MESAHKSEEAAETGVHLVREGYRSHKLKPYRKAAQAEKSWKRPMWNALYQKSLRENPQLASKSLLPLAAESRPLKRSMPPPSAPVRLPEVPPKLPARPARRQKPSRKRHSRRVRLSCPQERGWHRAGPLFGGLPPDEHHFVLLYAGTGHRFCGDRQHLPLR